MLSRVHVRRTGLHATQQYRAKLMTACLRAQVQRHVLSKNGNTGGVLPDMPAICPGLWYTCSGHLQAAAHQPHPFKTRVRPRVQQRHPASQHRDGTIPAAWRELIEGCALECAMSRKEGVCSCIPGISSMPPQLMTTASEGGTCASTAVILPLFITRLWP